MDNTKKLRNEIEDIKEILECEDKIQLNERLILENELYKKEKILNQIYAKRGQSHLNLKEKNYKRKRNIIKDKRKHGRFWITGSRQYALFCAERSIRSYKYFIPKGAGYRKIFDVPWTIW